MIHQSYQIADDELMTDYEPATAHRTKTPATDKWNPNVPFHCTQEEFMDYIHEIEAGEFMTWEEAQKDFEAWEKKFLASRLK